MSAENDAVMDPLWLLLGVALGIAVGWLVGNIVLGLAFGLPCGIMAGVVARNRRLRRVEAETRREPGRGRR